MLCPKCYSKVSPGQTQCACGFAGTAPPPEVPPVPKSQQADNSARLGRVFGLLVCGAMMAAGVLMTVASHDQAVNRGGGRYKIFTGLIACGAIGMFRVIASEKKE